ncbi:MAG TPA: branched-chain amino acid ABC transporter permease [bacterium (Candidatus Stahlbacteria)]|nr:branched-chain amino acid ABC transporter permease [Candidatus Stahlbacteria bacterium]
MNYLLHILIMLCIYGILALSLNLLIGYAGLLSLAHAAFYGIGAYASTLLMVRLGLNFFPALLIGLLISGSLALLIAYPSLRLKGDYFVLASLGFQIIVFSILYNWIGLTRGPYGIPGIPRPTIFGFEFNSLISYFFLTAVVFILIFLLSLHLCQSPFGRALKSLREDEIAAKVMGKDVSSLKIWVFITAAGLAAVSGSLYAGYITYIDPTSFTLDESIFIIAIVLMGGSGNLKGPLAGVLFMIILPEFLRFLGLPDTIAPNVRQMIYGLLLILLMRYRPQGLAGEYRFE